MRIWLILVLITLASCATMNLSDAGALRKGMSQNESRAHVGKAKKVFTVSTSVDKKEYQVELHYLKIAQESADYYLAYHEDKLVFWGYLHEFARSEKPEINDLGIQIQKQALQRNY